MLKSKVSKEIMDQIEKQQSTKQRTIQLYKEEKDYAEKNQLIPDDLKEKVGVVEKSSTARFLDAYIERCEKKTEQVISKEENSFLNQPIEYLKKHREEFIYLESDWFDVIGVDAISIELDDVFGTYDVMLGLKLKKKYETAIKASLNNQLTGDTPKFNLLFNHEDAVWDVNITLNDTAAFKEGVTIGDACQIVYGLLFKLVADVEENG